MKQIALVADMHGNWPATQALAEDLKRRGIREIYCLGDMIGKGPSSKETMQWTLENCQVILQGNWEEGNVWQESERFNLYLTIGQVAPTDHGKNPLTHSFLELKDENLNVSAVKKSEDGTGYVVRLFNPSDKTVKNAIRLNGGIAPIEKAQSPVERQRAEFELPAYSGKKWNEVKLVTLEELDDKALTMGEDGFVEFEITGKKILTIKFN